MRIASWNVNSIKARLNNVLDWVRAEKPDVLLFQELKCQDPDFPALEFESMGYSAHVHGQKSYNGVAILSRREPEDVLQVLPGDPADDQARYVEATIGGMRIASLYLPNGNPADTPKYDYKLAWMERLRRHTLTLLREHELFVLGGDYNVIPEEIDVYDPSGWTEDALFKLETRRAFRRLLNLGLVDAYRALHPHQAHAYTYWDYQAGRWQRDQGLRIDHLLLSPAAADRLLACEIDRDPRGEPKASDHTPIWCDLADAPPGPRLT